MSWIAITEAHVLTVMSGPELDALRAAALDAGQADPLQPTIDQVTDLVRGYAAGVVVLGASGTIPQKLLAPALDIIASRIPQRVDQSPSDGRAAKETAAISLLKDVAAGRFKIEEPTTASTETSAVPSPKITPRCRHFTRAAESGS